MILNFAFGQRHGERLLGTVPNRTRYGFISAGSPMAVPTFQTLVTTHIIQLPVNCVIAGQQKEPVKKAMGLSGAISGPLKGIFNE